MQGFGGVQITLQGSLPELESKLEFLQDGIDDLGEITDDLRVPEITEYVAEPVPEEVSEAVPHLHSADDAGSGIRELCR